MSWKDPKLKNIYVMRCKCGKRPYHDRIAIFPTPQWIACNCGRKSISANNLQEAINNWNLQKLEY